jgi:ADP-heptose:LPS heptosyltransferase
VSNFNTLVLRPGALGDTLLAVPALRALRRTCGPLTLAAHAGAARFLESVGEIDRGLAFDDPALAWLFTGPSQEPSVVAWMADRPAGLPPGALVAPSRPAGMDEHCARYLLGTLASLGIDLTWDDRIFEVAPIRSQEILVHPGSGSRVKNWPTERFAAVIRGAERSVRLIVGDADQTVAARLGGVPRLEHPSLEELAARLAGCHAYLGNDSGVSHLAGLCGARSLVLFGPTDPTVWRPIGPRVEVLRFDMDPADVAARLS